MADIDSTYKDIVDSIANEVPAENGFLMQKVRKIVRNFLMDTELWQYNTTAIDYVANTQIYSLPIPYNAVVKSIVKVWSGNPASTFDTPADVRLYKLVPINKIELVEEQQEAVTDALIVRVSLFPQLSSHDTPVDIVERWNEAIEFGVKAELFGDVNKPWSNKQMAMEMNQAYRSKISEGLYSWISDGQIKRRAMTGWTVI